MQLLESSEGTLQVEKLSELVEKKKIVIKEEKGAVASRYMLGFSKQKTEVIKEVDQNQLFGGKENENVESGAKKIGSLRVKQNELKGQV